MSILFLLQICFPVPSVTLLPYEKMGGYHGAGAQIIPGAAIPYGIAAQAPYEGLLVSWPSPGVGNLSIYYVEGPLWCSHIDSTFRLQWVPVPKGRWALDVEACPWRPEQAFTSVFIPNKTINVDESLWAFKGHHHALQYMPRKRAKRGIKVYKLCSSKGPEAGYTTAFKIYMVQDHGGFPASMKAVIDLMEKGQLFDKGYELYTDN